MGSGGGAGSGNMAYYNNGNDNGGMSGAMAAMNLNGGGGGARARDWRGMMMAPQQEVCSIFIPSTAVGAVIGTKGTYIRCVSLFI